MTKKPKKNTRGKNSKKRTQCIPTTTHEKRKNVENMRIKKMN